MTLRELRDKLNDAIPPEWLDREVKVWLPGSTIRLNGRPFTHPKGFVVIEGNLDEGSALCP